MDKFGRRYELTIYPGQYLNTSPGNDPSKFSFGDFGVTESVVIKNPFTLIFNIRKGEQAFTNVANFQIYNLGETTRRTIYKDQTDYTCLTRIVLRAGYVDPLPIVFQGNVEWCTSYRQQGQTNFITDIEAVEGIFEIKNSFSNRNFPGTVQKQEVVDYLVKDLTSMGSPDNQIGLSRGAIHQYKDVHFRKVLSGYSWDILKEETDNCCYISNGKLNVVAENEFIEGHIDEISSSTGLLGSPKQSEHYVITEMLFEPGLELSQFITLNSTSQRLYNGEYKIYSLNHFGMISDSVGGKCQTNVTLFSFRREGQLLQPLASLA